MTIELFQPADYVLCGLTIVLAVTGLFRGFSGTLAFGIATAAAALSAVFGWRYSLLFSANAMVRGGAVLVGTLLAFGLVRTIVRRLVNGLLAQPADAVFGFLLGASLGGVLLVVWAYSGLMIEHSYLATAAAQLVR